MLASMAASKKKPGKPRGRKALPPGGARVHIGARVTSATAAVIKASGKTAGETLDFFVQEIARLKKLAGE